MELTNKKSRRKFLKTMGVAGAGTLAGYAALGSSLFREPRKKITILHTNDTHSRLDPYPANDPNYPSMGGYARRAAMISKLRKEDPELLLLDAGDIFQGTPYYNMYGGEPELRLMSKMGYDAATVGNHEFDNGLDGFNEVIGFAEFPFISSNYDFSETILNGKIKDHLIIERYGIKIGIYGLGIRLEGLVGNNLYGETQYYDPISTARKMERMLKSDYGCRLIICLSHLGYEYQHDRVSDVVIAANTNETDVIIGGHTHFLLDPPAIHKNINGQNVFIGQAGYGGVRLGKMEVFFNDNEQIDLVESNTIKIHEKQEP